MTALLEVEGLTASYGLGSVLDGVSLRLGAGEVFAVIGPNGHGKTSLLRAISGLMPRQTGQIAFCGQSLVGLSPSKIARAGIVHVPQGDLVYKGMSVLENLLVGGSANSSASITRRQLEKVISIFPRLKEKLPVVANALSGGERRMLGIGRGLMLAQARLIMLDEPSLGLAPVVIDQIYSTFHELRAGGLTILVVEENVSRATQVAAHLALINHGKVVWTGGAAELGESRTLREVYLGL